MVLVTLPVDSISLYMSLATRKSIVVAFSPYFTFPLYLSSSFFSFSLSHTRFLFLCLSFFFQSISPLLLASSHYSLRFFHVNSLLFLSTLLRIGVLPLVTLPTLFLSLFPPYLWPLSRYKSTRYVLLANIINNSRIAMPKFRLVIALRTLCVFDIITEALEHALSSWLATILPHAATRPPVQIPWLPRHSLMLRSLPAKWTKQVGKVKVFVAVDAT